MRNYYVTVKLASMLAAALVSVFLIAGCSKHTDKISDINGNPAHYLHHDVTIAGEVTRVYEMPLGISDLAAYRVNDGSGQIWVISHAGAPVIGDKVGLKGTLEPLIDLKAGALGNLGGNVIEEHQRRT